MCHVYCHRLDQSILLNIKSKFVLILVLLTVNAGFLSFIPQTALATKYPCQHAPFMVYDLV
jgi:hypothetical protein